MIWPLVSKKSEMDGVTFCMWLLLGFKQRKIPWWIRAKEPHTVMSHSISHMRGLLGEEGMQRLPLSEGRWGKRLEREGTGFL